MIRAKFQAPPPTRSKGCNTTPLLTPTRRLSFRTLAAAAALLAGLTTAQAAEPDWTDLGHVEGWNISATSYVCLGQARYKNGTELGFAIGRNGKAIITISKMGWTIPEGNYPVTVAIDRAKPVAVTGQAEGAVVSVDWEVTEDMVNLISNGAILYATVGQQQFRYDLGGSRQMLQALLSCVRKRVQAANPFAGQTQQPRRETPAAASNPFQRL
jgi:hypothetical protein